MINQAERMTNKKKGTWKFLKLAAINILVLIALLETIALIIYGFKHGALFYFQEKRPVPQVLERREPRAEAERQLTNKRVHPFFGYTYPAGLPNTNNYGFNCPFDFPLQKENDNWFIIGIFGGSVADDFYREGRERLAEQLKLKPAFANKEIFFLNFAAGGYKQPQQLQVLTYFLSIGQELDVVIEIDGLNEVVFCANNNRLNVDIAMPSAQHFLPLRDLLDRQAMTDEKLELTWNIHQLKKKISALDEKMKTTPLASFYWILSALRQNAYRQYQEEILRFDQFIQPVTSSPHDSLLNMKFTPKSRDDSQLMTSIAHFWARSSLLMHAVQVAHQGQYLHILQPNQYFSHKSFTDDEKKYAVDNQSVYSLLVKKGYPALVKAADNLKEKNVHAVSAVTIFDTIQETIYTDNCCHFNTRGHEILADFIAGLL